MNTNLYFWILSALVFVPCQLFRKNETRKVMKSNFVELNNTTRRGSTSDSRVKTVSASTTTMSNGIINSNNNISKNTINETLKSTTSTRIMTTTSTSHSSTFRYESTVVTSIMSTRTTRQPVEKPWPTQEIDHSDSFHRLAPSQRKKIIIGGYIFAVCTSLGVIWMIVSHVKTKKILERHQDSISKNVRGKYHLVTTNLPNKKFSLVITDNGHVREIPEPRYQ